MTKQRVIILDEKGDQVTDVITEEGNRCKGKDVESNVKTSSEADGKLTQVRVRMCGVGKQAMAEAIDGIRKARDEIAQDNELPDSTSKEVFRNLMLNWRRSNARAERQFADCQFTDWTTGRVSNLTCLPLASLATLGFSALDWSSFDRLSSAFSAAVVASRAAQSFAASFSVAVRAGYLQPRC